MTPTFVLRWRALALLKEALRGPVNDAFAISLCVAVTPLLQSRNETVLEALAQPHTLLALGHAMERVSAAVLQDMCTVFAIAASKWRDSISESTRTRVFEIMMWTMRRKDIGGNALTLSLHTMALILTHMSELSERIVKLVANICAKQAKRLLVHEFKTRSCTALLDVVYTAMKASPRVLPLLYSNGTATLMLNFVQCLSEVHHDYPRTVINWLKCACFIVRFGEHQEHLNLSTCLAKWQERDAPALLHCCYARLVHSMLQREPCTGAVGAEAVRAAVSSVQLFPQFRSIVETALDVIDECVPHVDVTLDMTKCVARALLRQAHMHVRSKGAALLLKLSAQVAEEQPTETTLPCCIACTVRSRDAVFVPCGHVAMCSICAAQMPDMRCAVCRCEAEVVEMYVT